MVKPTLVRTAPCGLTIAQGSDVGRVRQHNEDAWLILDLRYRANDDQAMAVLLVLADGMGGHARGHLASTLAVRTAAACMMQDVMLPYLSSEVAGAQQYSLHETLVRAVQVANTTVYRSLPNAGTTLTMALVLGQRAYLAHVGDSRAYMLENGVLRCITRDHSLAARLAETGHTAPEEIAGQRNILYRAVGHSDTIEVDTYTESLLDGSCLLLCSDGLWTKMSDSEITKVLMSEADVRSAVSTLITLANERGGEDNVTAILAVYNEG
ncbi:MAG: protein phosphatase 2C domain-containing protein [Anaerolineae bacterium]|nr:protein phosphatase 2C domain-containing protein [Anaerolineae bacterium]